MHDFIVGCQYIRLPVLWSTVPSAGSRRVGRSCLSGQVRGHGTCIHYCRFTHATATRRVEVIADILLFPFFNQFQSHQSPHLRLHLAHLTSSASFLCIILNNTSIRLRQKLRPLHRVTFQMVGKFGSVVLRVIQFIFAAIVLGLSIAAVRWQHFGSVPATNGYSAFTGAFGAVAGLMGLAAIWISPLGGFLMAIVDFLATVFFLAGGIVSAHLQYSSITR